jgi:hypothetical protein
VLIDYCFKFLHLRDLEGRGDDPLPDQDRLRPGLLPDIAHVRRHEVPDEALPGAYSTLACHCASAGCTYPRKGPMWTSGGSRLSFPQTLSNQVLGPCMRRARSTRTLLRRRRRESLERMQAGHRGRGANDWKGIVNMSHHKEIEEYYQQLIVDPTQPVAQGRRRWVPPGTAQSCHHVRGLSLGANANCFDCTSELETSFNFMIVYLRDIKTTAEMYKENVEGNRSLASQTVYIPHAEPGQIRNHSRAGQYLRRNEKR